jgi:hypothetical protein
MLFDIAIKLLNMPTRGIMQLTSETESEFYCSNNIALMPLSYTEIYRYIWEFLEW